MKRHIRIIVHVRDGPVFRMSVGRGRQTFKWLSLVVAQRIHQGMPDGRVRMREPTGPTGALVPVRISTHSDAFKRPESARIHPSDVIKDVVSDGDHVYIELMLKTALSDDGSIATSLWQDTAYLSGPAARVRQAKRVAAIEKRERVDRRLALLRAATVDTGAHAKVSGMLTTEREPLEAMFDRDWSRLHVLGWCEKNQWAELKGILSKYYSNIRDVFRYYSNILGSGAEITPDAFRMTPSEFEFFCRDARLLRDPRLAKIKPREVFEQVFDELILKYDAPLHKRSGVIQTHIAKKQSRLDRVLFMDALCVLAARMAYEGADLSSFKNTRVLPPFRAAMLMDLMDGGFLARSRKVQGKEGVRKLLVSRDVAKQIVREMSMLKGLFKDYSAPVARSRASRRGRRAFQDEDEIEPLMNINGFRRLLVDVGILSAAEPKSDAGSPIGSRPTSGSVSRIGTADLRKMRGPLKSISSLKDGEMSVTLIPETPVVGGGGGSGGPADPATSTMSMSESAPTLPSIWRGGSRDSMGAYDMETPPSRFHSPRVRGMGDGKALNYREVAHAFLLAQAEDEASVGFGMEAGYLLEDRVEKQKDIQELVFSEFVEALLRVALLKWTEDDIEEHEKFSLVLDALAVHWHLARPVMSGGLAGIANIAARKKKLEDVL